MPSALRIREPRLLCIALLLALSSELGCERDAVEWICPDLEAGDLVVTEIRGAQTGADTLGQWIEIYNASGHQVDLQGISIRLAKLSGGGEGAILVREATVVAPGGYAVIGQFETGAEPGYVDYGFGTDFGSSFYDSAAIELSSCGIQLDQLIYRGLPNTGTYSLDGALEPSATTNDVDGNWCTDAIPDPLNTQVLGIPGTPGESNRLCPTTN